MDKGVSYMLLRNGIKQALRSPVRLITLFVITALICGFLSIGLNLRQAAADNVELLRQEFDTVAIPTFRGFVNRNGALIFEDQYGSNFFEVPAQNFDRSVFENAAGVKDVLVHTQLGAHVDVEPYVLPGHPTSRKTYDVIIFTYKGKEPAVIGRSSPQQINSYTFSVTWSAWGYQDYPRSKRGLTLYSEVHPYMSRIWDENGTLTALDVGEMWPRNEEGEVGNEFVLQPGQRYIAMGEWWMDTHLGIKEAGSGYEKGKDALHHFFVKPDQAHSPIQLFFTENAFQQDYNFKAYHETYPSILPYDETFWETDAGKYYQDAIDACLITGNSLPVVATPDLSLFSPFYNEGVYISEGRTFTEEDYATGNKVCLVSSYLAFCNGWHVGDTLDLSFFPATYSYTGLAKMEAVNYEPFVEHYDPATDTYSLEMTDAIVDKGTYTIVGFYDGNVTTDVQGSIVYPLDEGISQNVIIVPEQSVQRLPEVPLHQYNTTILLDDEQILYFMADMEATGLLEQQRGQYMLHFDIYDQGYGNLKQSLRQLDTVSKLTLYLACAAAVAVVILLSVLTVIQNRRQIATLRSLGVRKHQIPAAVLSGVLLVCLLGACLGGFIGYKASDKVATYILETAQQDMADTSFSAMLAGDTEAKEEAYTIAIQSRPQAAVFAAAAVMLALTALSCTLTLIEARKSPMLTLGARE